MRRSSWSWRSRMSSWRTGETRTRCFCSRRRTLRWALEGALGIEAAHDIMPIAATHSHAKQRTACNRCNLLHELSLSRCTAQHAASRFEALRSSAFVRTDAAQRCPVACGPPRVPLHFPATRLRSASRCVVVWDVCGGSVLSCCRPKPFPSLTAAACARAAEDVRPCGGVRGGGARQGQEERAGAGPARCARASARSSVQRSVSQVADSMQPCALQRGPSALPEWSVQAGLTWLRSA